MEFLDRIDELAELRRVLNPATPPRFVVVFGRRRLGKSTLIKKALQPSDVYYMAGDFVNSVQIDMFKARLEERFPEIGHADFGSWESILMMLNRLTHDQFTLCLDEFPYMVKQSPELPSVLQRLIDSGDLKFNIIICGSSQRMMQDIVLSQSEPLYGRAWAIINVGPLPVRFLQQALGLDGKRTIEEYSVWGGVPRYWELREEYSDLWEAICGTLLKSTAVLYDEPRRLFLDDMMSTIQTESLLAVVASGANRLSEIASRMRREATALSSPLDRLIQMKYLRREIPYGENPKKSKKSIYRINDPMIDFYYTFIVPNMSAIGRGRINSVRAEIAGRFNDYVSRHWEYICREAVSSNCLLGYQWNEASRWWGTVSHNGDFRQLELDVVAESTDGAALLVGECKWTNPEIASELYNKLIGKAALLPMAKGKKIVPVLFLKNEPKDGLQNGLNIMLPQSVIDLAWG